MGAAAKACAAVRLKIVAAMAARIVLPRRFDLMGFPGMGLMGEAIVDSCARHYNHRYCKSNLHQTQR
jgi:hypothetical protein